MINIIVAKKDVNTPYKSMAAETVHSLLQLPIASVLVQSQLLSTIAKLYQEMLLHRSLKNLHWPSK